MAEEKKYHDADLASEKSAKMRYGLKETITPAKDTRSEQAPQFDTDKHGPGYDIDTPNNWLRGNGCKPGFDGKKG